MSIFIKKGETLIPVGVTVNIGSKGIQIPSIEDFATDEYGLISWESPDISKLEEFNPTMSYILDINGRVFETSNTYFDALQYLYNGNNYVSIKVKIAVYDEGYNKQYYFSKPSQYIMVISQTLPIETKLGVSVVDDYGNIYIVGGVDESGIKVSGMIKFNPKTYVIEQIPLIYSGSGNAFYNNRGCGCIYNNTIYIFGGSTQDLSSTICSDKLYKINLNDYSISTLNMPYDSVSSVYGYCGGACIVVDKYIYYFSGSARNNPRNAIYKFDTENNTFEQLFVNMPYETVGTSNSYSSCIYYNGYIYISLLTQSVELNLFRFNPITNEIQTLTPTNSKNYFSNLRLIQFRNKLFFIGSQTDISYVEAYEYDVTNNIVNKISNFANEVISYVPLTSVSNNKIYMLSSKANGTSKQIIESVIL